ncbi:uncharacterized protein J3R85_002078 [Psidium guajava]|nr:uncharacterized protein J3R85_002078 [Psidium guajava]
MKTCKNKRLKVLELESRRTELVTRTSSPRAQRHRQDGWSDVNARPVGRSNFADSLPNLN